MAHTLTPSGIPNPANSPSDLPVAVTGSTGFVGRYVVRTLLERGYRVRALVRTREKAKAQLPPVTPGGSLQLVVGDVLDAASLGALLAGTQAAIHLVGIIREKRDMATGEAITFRKAHIEATRRMVVSCGDHGVHRYLHMSALGVTPNGVSEYQKSKFEAETLVRLSSLGWTIFRPGLIHGPDGEFVQMMASILRGKVAPYLFAPYFTRGIEEKRVPLGGVTHHDPSVQPVAVEDVASAFASAISNQETIGEVYNLVGSEVLDWPTLLRFMRDALGAGRIQPFGLPSEPAAIGATIAAKLGFGSLLPFDAGMARMAAQDSTASLDKFRHDFRFEPRAFREAFTKYAAAV